MNKKKLLIILLIVFILIFFFIRLFPIRTSHWWDETVYLQNAEVIFSGRTNYDEFSFRPPLLSILFAFIFIFWHSTFSASIMTAAICTLTPLFIFLIGKKLFNIKTGIIAGLIVGFAPFIVMNSNFILTDIPAVSLMAISFYLVLFNEKKLFIFLSGIFLSLATLIKFTSVLLFFVIILYFILNKVNLRKILIFVAGATIIMLPYFIWAQINFGFFLNPIIKGSLMVSDVNEDNLFYIINIQDAFTILPIIGAILWFIITSINIKNKKYTNWKINIVLIFWIAIYLIYLTATPHKELRYIFPITIPLILLGSYELSIITNKVKNNYLIYLIYFAIILITLMPIVNVQKNPIRYGEMYSFIKGGIMDQTKTDEMKVGEYIKNNLSETKLIYIRHDWPVIAYYSGKKIEIISTEYNDYYARFSSIIKENQIIVVSSKGYSYPTKEWADKNAKLKLLKTEGNLLIYGYNNTN